MSWCRALLRATVRVAPIFVLFFAGYWLGYRLATRSCEANLHRIDQAVQKARLKIARRRQADYTCLTTGKQTTWAPCLTPEEKAWLEIQHQAHHDWMVGIQGHHYQRE